MSVCSCYCLSEHLLACRLFLSLPPSYLTPHLFLCQAVSDAFSSIRVIHAYNLKGQASVESTPPIFILHSSSSLRTLFEVFTAASYLHTSHVSCRHTTHSTPQVCDLYTRLVSGANQTMVKQAHITGAMMGYSQVWRVWSGCKEGGWQSA